jgi:hypothetical protein
MISRGLLRSALLLCATAGASWSACPADTLLFNANLTDAQETPPHAGSSTGFATVTLSGNILSVMESFSNLTAPATGAHIHCCALPGTSAPIVLPFTFPPFPNSTSGSFSQTFDLSTFAFTGGATETSFITGLESGLAYVNIHDVNFPAGEIRGQLLQVTPEPGSFVLIATGALGMAGVVRRRTSKLLS